MDKSDQKSLYVLLVALLLGIFLLLSGRSQKDSSSVAPRVRNDLPSQIDDRINIQLKQTHLKSEIKSLEIEIENEAGQKISPGNGSLESVRPDLPSKVNPLEFEQENPGQQVLRDLKYDQRKSRPMTPEQRINSKLERDNWVRDQEKLEEEVFVKKFIENARDGGVDIRVNKNLDVIGISPAPREEPIRIPQSIVEPASPSGHK